MVSLYRDPEGENVFSKSIISHDQSNFVTNADGGQLGSKDLGTIESLQSRVKELELEVSRYKNATSKADPLMKKSTKVSFIEDNGKIEHLPNIGATNSDAIDITEDGNKFDTVESEL